MTVEHRDSLRYDDPAPTPTFDEPTRVRVREGSSCQRKNTPETKKAKRLKRLASKRARRQTLRAKYR